MSEKLYVGNIPPQMSAGALSALFKLRAHVVELKIIEDDEMAGGERFAFVRTGSEADARILIEIFDGLEVEGKHLIVAETRAQLNENKQGGYGGYGRRGKE